LPAFAGSVVEVPIMRSTLLIAVLALVFTPVPARAQFSLLEQVEKSLGEVPAVAQANKGYLGFTPDENDKAKNGVRVVQVKPGGPADLAGLKANDLITAVDGKPVATLDEMDALLDKTTPGQQLRMSVSRGGTLQTVTAKLGQRPSAPPDSETNPGEPALTPPTSPPSATPPAAAPPTTSPPAASFPSTTPPVPALGAPATNPTDPLNPAATDPVPGPIRSRPLDLGPPPAATEDPLAPAPAPATTPATDDSSAAASPAAAGASLGITVVPLTDEARAAYGLAIRSGALITQIRPGSPADRAGLPLGAVIATADGQRIETADDLVAFIRAARPGQEVELGYMQGGVMRRKNVRLAPVTSAAEPPPPSGSFGPVPPSGRPLLGRVERMLDSIESTRGASTVYDPSEMARLKQQVSELTEQVKALEERLKAVEGRGGASPPPAPAPGLGGFAPVP
jgi:membrane-associated protease RseP (regulator of RpoE activity)